jgi:type IV pilus assembly protein PilA
LTLIELLITIAVLAIVAAIAVPVVTNVVNSTEDRAVSQTLGDIQDFTSKYNNTGTYTYTDATQTFEGYVDLNGDGVLNDDEKVEELVVDSTTFTVLTGGESLTSSPAGTDASTDIAGNYDAEAGVDVEKTTIWGVDEAN